MLQDSPGAALTAYKGYMGDCRYVISHMVNGQDPGADHLSFGSNKGGHDQTWAVTKAQAWLHIQSLLYTSRKGNKINHTRLSVKERDFNSHREAGRVVQYLKMLCVSRSS